MATTSIRWAFATELIALIAGAESMATVLVKTSRPGDTEITDEMVYIVMPITGTVALPVGVGGRKPRDDKFEVRLAVVASRPSIDEAMVRLEEIVADVCDLLAGDPSLGDFDGVLSAEVSATSFGADTYADGVWGAGEITVSVHSRLT